MIPRIFFSVKIGSLFKISESEFGLETNNLGSRRKWRFYGSTETLQLLPAADEQLQTQRKTSGLISFLWWSILQTAVCV